MEIGILGFIGGNIRVILNALRPNDLPGSLCLDIALFGILYTANMTSSYSFPSE